MIYVVSALMAAAGAWWISRYAYALGLMDKPCGRSSHDDPKPKGGGIGILLAFVMGCFWFELPLAFCLPAAVLSLFSLVGDRVNLSPHFRLVIQFGAASSFLVWEPVPLLPGAGYFFLFPFLTIYIVGTTNFYNFMDGINGIAGITGVVGFLLLGGYGVGTGQDVRLVSLVFLVAFSCGGFLPFNVPRARVFMGDVGSILLGFVFACIVVCFAKTFGDFIVLTGFLFPFYADELVTMYVRIRDGQRLSLPHRRHLYQLLANELNIPHWKVAVGFGFLQLAVGISVIGLQDYGMYPVTLLLLGCFVGFIGYSAFVRKKAGQKYEQSHRV